MANKKIIDLPALAASDAAAAANAVEAWIPALGVGSRSKYATFDVLRGALQRLGNVYDVTDPKYGADPTFSSDSLSAINAALTDISTAGKGILLLPPGGTFKVMGALTIPSAKQVMIVGYGATIKHASGGAVIDWTNTHLTSEFRCGLAGLTIDGNTAGSTVVTLNGHTFFRMQDVTVTGGSTPGTGTGLKLVSMWDSHFDDVYVTNCGDTTHPCCVLDANGAGNDTLNNCTFNALHIEPSDLDAIYLDIIGNATNEVGDNKFYSLKLHGNPTSGNPGRALLRLQQYARANDFFSPILGFGKGASVAQVEIDGQRNRIFAGSWGIGGSGTPAWAVQFKANAHSNVIEWPNIKTPSTYVTPNVVIRSEAGAAHNVVKMIGDFGGTFPLSEAGRTILDVEDISTNIGYQEYAADGIAVGTTPGFVQTAEFINTLTDAATIAVNARNGNAFKVTLGGNRTMGAPSNSKTGQTIRFLIIQDGTGGRTLAWNAVFKTAWSDTGNTLNKRSTIQFQYDGTNWNQMGSQSPYI